MVLRTSACCCCLCLSCTSTTAVWELLVRDRPFKGLLEGDLVVGVCDQGLRPTFPPGCPASYVALAQQCWADDPSLRPTAPQVKLLLLKVLEPSSLHTLHSYYSMDLRW
jgi:hypothetical protein